MLTNLLSISAIFDAAKNIVVHIMYWFKVSMQYILPISGQHSDTELYRTREAVLVQILSHKVFFSLTGYITLGTVKKILHQLHRQNEEVGQVYCIQV